MPLFACFLFKFVRSLLTCNRISVAEIFVLVFFSWFGLWQIWVDAAQKKDSGLDKAFVDELLRMGVQKKAVKGTAMHSDAKATHLGVFSSTRRLQPRYQVWKEF